jgi:hypothetical protein
MVRLLYSVYTHFNMNAFYTFDLFNYGLYTRMQATAKNYEIRTDTRYFRKPCNNERPRYDVAWLRV